jgi:two-component system chemotaxis sensor kinase CheA
VSAEEIVHGAEGTAIVHDGKIVPFAPLSRCLGASLEPARDAWSAVVLTSSAGVAAVGVDQLLEPAEIILRPLPILAPADRIVSGISLDVEGNPQLVLDPAGVVAAAARPYAAAETSEHRTRPPILIVDDSLTTRMLEQSILESARYEVDLAASGEEGLEKALRRRYGLFLVDVEMPGMDGFTFVERTRADPDLRDIPAILVTSRSSPEDRQRGDEVGAVAYIPKGEFDQAQLLDKIEGLVG